MKLKSIKFVFAFLLSITNIYSQNVTYQNAVVSSANELASEVGIKNTTLTEHLLDIPIDAEAEKHLVFS